MTVATSTFEAETASEFTSDMEDPCHPLAQEPRSRAGRCRGNGRIFLWMALPAALALAAFAAYAQFLRGASLRAASSDVVVLAGDSAQDESMGTVAEITTAATTTTSYLGTTVEIPEGMSVTDYLFLAPTSTLPPSVCQDTADWTNKYNCRAELFLESEGCSQDGWTCFGYEHRGWCKDGVALTEKFPFAFVDTDSGINKHEALNDPALNCCVCGKSKGVLGEAPGGNGIGVPFFVAPTSPSAPSVCQDTPGWTNKYNCRAELFLESEGCSQDGWTCFGYEHKGWCKDGVALTEKFSFAFVDTDNGINRHEALNDPTLNCCICGKPKGVLGEAPGGNGIGTPFFG